MCFFTDMDVVRMVREIGIVRGVIPTLAQNLASCIHPLMAIFDGSSLTTHNNKELRHLKKIAIS